MAPYRVVRSVVDCVRPSFVFCHPCNPGANEKSNTLVIMGDDIGVSCIR
jgi:hypothetical protein